jgi:type IV secretory pathway VirB2 component (pilin)
MNPSGQPFPNQFGGAPPPPGAGGGAREALNVPGILFIVFGSLSILYGLYGLVGGGANEAQLNQALSDPNLPPAAKDFIRMLAGPGAKVLNLIAAAMAGLMVFGGVQMRSLKSYPVAIAACVIGMLPCTSCCCVTIPISIWALTILMRPEIKSSFS